VDALEALGAQAGEAQAGPPAGGTTVASPTHAPMLGIEDAPHAEEEAGAAAASPAEQH
jgi:hypothetical protein